MEQPIEQVYRRLELVEGKQRGTDITLDNHTEMLKEISGKQDQHTKMLIALQTEVKGFRESVDRDIEGIHRHLNRQEVLLQQILAKLP